MEVLTHVAANVRRIRRRRSLTQEALAERAELDVTTEQRVERAATNLSLDILVRLADALAVHPAALLRAAEMALPQRGRPRKARAKGSAKKSAKPAR